VDISALEEVRKKGTEIIKILLYKINIFVSKKIKYKKLKKKVFPFVPFFPGLSRY